LYLFGRVFIPVPNNTKIILKIYQELL